MSTVKPLSRRTIPVALFQPADEERLAELADAAAKAIDRAGPSRVGDGTPAKESAALYDEFYAEAETRASTVELVALPKKDWRALKDEHPERMVEVPHRIDGEDVLREEPDPRDHMGFNVQTIADPLIRACIVPGQFDSIGERDAYLEDLSDPNFSRLFNAAVALNTQGSVPPKAGLVSLLEAISAETSTSPDRLG